MSQPYNSILLFGTPGVGKGTQGAMLGRIPGFHHMATGDIFRSLDPHSEMGREFLRYSTRGELVPDELTIELWKQNAHARTVLGEYRPSRDLLVLDGIPRNITQAKAMDEHIRVHGVVHLVCQDIDEMIRRMKKRAVQQNRPDDADEKVIRRRFEVYKQNTSPVLAHYGEDLQHEVDALGSPAEVLSKILAITALLQEKHFGNPLKCDK